MKPDKKAAIKVKKVNTQYLYIHIDAALFVALENCQMTNDHVIRC